MGLMEGVVDKTKQATTKLTGGEAPQNLKLLFWIAVLVQVVDIFILRFDRGANFGIAISMYGGLAIISLLFFHKEGHLINVKKLMPFLILSAIYVGIPFFMWAVPKFQMFGGTNLFDWVNFMLAILPAWPIYIGMQAKIPFVKHYLNFWIVFLVFVFIFGVGYNLSPGKLAGVGGRPELLQAGNVVEYLFERTAEIAKNFWGSMNPKGFISRAINSSGLNYYTGMVDNNEATPVGLYIDNVRLADRYVYVGSEAIIWADIRGKSFTEEITFEPECYIKGKYQGVADPSMFYILGEEHDTLSCTFNNLDKGSYTAYVGGSFNFETWAYVTYTFVDLDTKRAMDMQNKDINVELNIPRMPEAVYTNGPIMLGMSAMVDQPVPLDVQNNNREPVIGVTIDDRWTDTGGLELADRLKVHEFEIKVPKEFELVKCDRKAEKSSDEKEQAYDSYLFSWEGLEDFRQSFQSVTCRIKVIDPAKLLMGAQKVQRTFVAKVKYDYKLAKPVSIYVKE